MNKMILTVIGGGSTNWMPGLMRDVYLIDEVDEGEIRLVDPRADRTAAIADMLRVFNQVRKKNYKISVVPDRREALNGANFVMTTFSPGSMDAFWNDLEIPIKYGIRLPVSMTVGIPGLSAAIRTVPIAYEIVHDMEDMCPGAWLLNVTNPMSTVVRAMNMAANSTKVIGMCHEFHAFDQYMGPMLGLYRPEGMHVTEYLYKWLPAQGFEYTVAGINHLIWLTKANLNGADVLPTVRQYCADHLKVIDERRKEQNTGQVPDPWHNAGAVKLALCRQFGYLPLPGDRHLVEYFPSLCNLRNGFGMKYGVLKTTVDARRLGAQQDLDFIRNVAAGEETVSWNRSGEEMTQIMRAIIGKSSTQAIVNAPNKGQITNMPDDVIVETLADVSDKGVKPRISGDLPGAAGTWCRLYADIHELTVQAALNGDRSLLIEAMSLDPSNAGADFSEIPDMADELLLANRAWLPRFFKE